VLGRRGWASYAGDERGAIAVTVALGMTLLLGSAAIAIDLGHMMAVRTESQRVADLSALAGTSAYIQTAAPNVDVAIDGWSKEFALRNQVNNDVVTLQSADIVADILTERVSVVVRHTQARGNAIPTVFGGALRIGGVDVVTRATAEASPASAAHCALPFFLVDRWNELGGAPDRFDVGIDYYEAYNPFVPTDTYTGYDQGDVGFRIAADPAGAAASDQGRPMANWYFPFAPNELPGGPGTYQISIESCLDPGRVYAWADDIISDPTPMPLATNLSLQVLFNSDPEAAWDAALRCVTNASALGLGDPSNCRSSPRIRSVLLIPPGTAPGANQQSVTVGNLAGVFIEGVSLEISLVLMGYTGVSPARASGAGFRPNLVRTLRIVE